MAMQHGRVCALSAGGRSTSGYGRSRSRMTGSWQKSKTYWFVTNTFQCIAVQYTGLTVFKTFSIKWMMLYCFVLELPTDYWYFSTNVLGIRLQKEEEAAYASSQGVQTQPHSQSTALQPLSGHTSLGSFSKFEEKKTNEKTRKVTTVKKFFSPSSRTASKKGLTWRGL